MAGEHETLERKAVFEGQVVRLYLDKVRLPNGVEAEREVVLHRGAVAMVALDEDEGVFLVRQYRQAPGKELVEIPAGKLAEGEDPLECARRELMEEIGRDAGEWTQLATFYTSPGFSDEILHLYLARGLRPVEARPDEDEFLEIMHVTLAEALSMVSRGEIEDGKTIAGLSLTALLLRGEYGSG
ncbi:MAG: NUDIX hydrolase [Actinomycetota bacterium]|nr:NUDIX hydrolase [Actinomycetota bacterium]MDD5666591.1 NUDIX hydrolase [Actinomycetota bacterium]